MGKKEEAIRQKMFDYQVRIGATSDIAPSTIDMGIYTSGLPYHKDPQQQVNPYHLALCAVTKDDFIFFYAPDDEIGKIPRNAINQMTLVDKTRTESGASAGKILAFGVLAFGMKKEKVVGSIYLVIDWDLPDGSNTNTLFEFKGENDVVMARNPARANDTLNQLKSYILPKVTTLKADEKKCPFCAEIIKAEAKICRFCNSKLE